MTSEHPVGRTPTDVSERLTLARALEKSEGVQAKVAACADDLASVNDTMKTKIAEGEITILAQGVLADSEKVESTVQECAIDLHEINKTLAQGIDDLKHTVAALARAQQALAHTEASLATAQDEEKEARHRAMHDPTTGLPNRGLFDDRLAHAISLAERHAWTLAVMFLDLDRFKSINDTHGHAAGDAVLKEIARRLSEHARDEDTVCRSGGDEFLYLLMNPQGTENIERIAGGVLKNIAQPITLGDLQLLITLSIGIAVYPEHGTTADELVKNADTAMYRAKPRNGCVFFSTSDGTFPASRKSLGNS
jgi:diguanylate cyclase (GGDEF)-like protein